MRRLSSVLLFSTWISFGVSTVTVANNKVSGEYGSSLILQCNVTGNDTFDGWKTPAGNIVNNSFVFKYEQNGIDLKILKLVSNYSGTWTCLSKGGNSDTVTVTILDQTTTNSATPTPTNVAATTSDNNTSSTIKATAFQTTTNSATPTPTKVAATNSGKNTSSTIKATASESAMNMSITVQDGKTLVSWKPSKEKAFYFIRYRRVGGHEWMNTSILTQNKYEFSTLDHGQKYEFQVYIVLTENPRPYTKIQSSDIAYEEPHGTKNRILIAVVVISLVLLALIIFDILCCFCNNCGFFYTCVKLFKKGKGNYKAKDGSPQEEMNLNEFNANQDDPGWV